MSIPTLTFFNNKGGVGKTTLVYHLAWMFSELGVKTLVIDCDPQANLTSAFVKDEDLLTYLWDKPTRTDGEEMLTMFDAVEPLLETGDIAPVKRYVVNENLKLILGDLRLSAFEDALAMEWTQALGENSNKRAMLLLSAFWRIAQRAATTKAMHADLILFDVGPNLGAINRSVLISSDYVVMPLGADMFSLIGLRNLGPVLKKWKTGWRERIKKLNGAITQPLPSGDITPVGYIAMQHQEIMSRPLKAYNTWLNRIPNVYRESLKLPASNVVIEQVMEDPECLGLLRHFRSLIPLAQEARKPVFLLKSADGAIGSHSGAVNKAYEDFEILAKKILAKIGIAIPVRS